MKKKNSCCDSSASSLGRGTIRKKKKNIVILSLVLLLGRSLDKERDNSGRERERRDEGKKGEMLIRSCLFPVCAYTYTESLLFLGDPLFDAALQHQMGPSRSLYFFSKKNRDLNF